MSALPAAVAVLAVALAAAVLSVRAGILLGRRLDGITEAAAHRDGAGEEVGSDD